MMNSNKAQSAIEFVILVGFILFFFTVFFLAVQENMADKIREKYNIAIKEIALTVQDEINFALKSTNGYLREFKLSESVEGKNYEISIVNNMVYVKTTDNKYAISLPVVSVVGQPKKGGNEILRADNVIYLNEKPPSCTYGEWVSQGCGIKNCKAEEMYQNRTFSGQGGCSAFDGRCVEDGNCKNVTNVTDAVSWWKFEIDFRDYADNNNGTGYGNAHVGGSGDYALQALVLDGNGDYVDVGSNANIHFAPSQNYTFLAWFKAKQQQNNTYILSDGRYSSDGWKIEYTYDNRIYAGPAASTIVNTSVLLLNTWYHVALIYDSSPIGGGEFPKMQLYLNGNLIDSADSSQMFMPSTGNFTMGALLYANFTYFNGAIDDVMVFNRTLFANEINFLYNNQTKT